MTDTAPTEQSNDVTTGRILLGLAGFFALVVSLAAPDGSVEATVTAIATVAGSEYLLAAAIGVVTLLVGIAAFVTGREAATQTRMPEPERPVPVPAPGDPFQKAAADWRCLLPLVGRKRRAKVQRRLFRTAVETVMVAENCTRETATRRIETGAWTSDDVAAEFLAEPADDPISIGRFSALLRGRTPTQYRTDRTISAITTVVGVESESDG